MRIHFGGVPEEFSPDESWRTIREPGPILLQVIAVPVGVVMMLATIEAWRSFGNTEPLHMDSLAQGVNMLIVMLLSFPAIIIVHELIHAGVHPGQGRRPETVLGIWPSKLLFYAHYEGPLTRDRFLAVFVAPLLAITVLPLALGWAGLVPGGMADFFLAWCSTWNALFACGDVVGFALILFQVPRGALVRNRGWRTYWRPAAPA